MMHPGRKNHIPPEKNDQIDRKGKKTCVVCEFNNKTPGCDNGKENRKKCPYYKKEDEVGINRAMKDKKMRQRRQKSKKNEIFC